MSYQSLITVTVFLTLSACGQDPSAGGGDAPQTAPASIGANAPTEWTQGQSDALIKSIDTAMMDMVATQVDGAAPTVAPLPINVTAACDQAFASDGSISVLGSYRFPQNANTPASFVLTLTYDACPLKTSDGNTVSLAGIGLHVAGTVATTTAEDESVTYAFKVDSLLGDMTLSTNGAQIPCKVDAAGTATYVWDDNLSLTAAYNGTFCAQVMRGQITQKQAITLP